MRTVRQHKLLGAEFACWESGGGFLCLYTEDPATSKALFTYRSHCTTYEFRGKTVAWQFRIHKRKLKFIEHLLAITRTDE